jgi:hypothetical protein
VELSGEEDIPINVELTHDQYRTLGLQSGEAVFVKVRDARVFVQREDALR